MLLPFCPLPFLAERVNSVHVYRWYYKYPNLNVAVLFHQRTHNPIISDSPLEDFGVMSLAKLICRFADDAALLTHIGIMIQGRG